MIASHHQPTCIDYHGHQLAGALLCLQAPTERSARCWYPIAGVTGRPVTSLPAVQLPEPPGLRTLVFVVLVLVSCTPCCACVGCVLLASAVTDKCGAQRWLGRLRCDVPAALGLQELEPGTGEPTGDHDGRAGLGGSRERRGLLHEEDCEGDPAACKSR